MKGSKRKNKRKLKVLAHVWHRECNSKKNGNPYIPIMPSICPIVWNDFCFIMDRGLIYRGRHRFDVRLTPKGRILLSKCKMLK